MSESMLTVEEAAAHLGELVERVYASREAAIIVKGGSAPARIVLVLSPGEAADDLSGFLRRWRSEYPDPDDQFAEAIDQSRQAIQPPYDPWA